MKLLLAAIVLAIVINISSYGIYWARFAFPSIFPSSEGGFDFLNLVSATLVFLLNPIVSFIIFYSIGPSWSFQSKGDFLQVLMYAFVGGAIGYLLGIAILFLIITATLPSTIFSVMGTSLASVISQVIGVIRSSLSMAFLAFTAMILRHIRSGGRLQTHALLDDPSPEPEEVPRDV